MKRTLTIPAGLVAYAHAFDLDAEELAQNTLEEMAGDFLELLIRGEDPRKDEALERFGAPADGLDLERN
jgi:hypothetical protein